MTRLLLLSLCLLSLSANAQTVGWFYSNPGAADGYILFAPQSSTKSFLLDKCGKKVHEWQSYYEPGLAVYLQEDGTLLRCGNTNNNQFMGGGQGGIVERFDWNSNLLWSYKISNDTQCQHHDAMLLPNGNVLAIAWEYHSKTDAQANGRISLGNKMWSDKIVEIQPIGSDSGVVVWQWRAWDHLVQDADISKPNYGTVADHPELIDINLGTLNSQQADWLHFNGLSYNEELDQLIVSCHNLNEIYIIDHSTTKEEAASHEGGTSGRGGDILYRWGNPENYDRGTSNDKKLFQQHNAVWLSNSKILLFNNGVGRPGTDYSTAESFTLPAMVNNNYPLAADSAYKPVAQDWIYAANPVTSLFSMVMGSAQRLPNGNTIICNATAGTFLEIDTDGNNLWKYVNPIDQNGNTPQGDQPFMNSCFRVTYLAEDYPGFDGQVLTPGAPLELNPDNYICPSIATAVSAVASPDQNPAVFPNPFSNGFMLQLPATLEKANLQVHDVTGRLLYEEDDIASSAFASHFVSLSLPPGMVIISISNPAQNYSWTTSAIAE